MTHPSSLLLATMTLLILLSVGFVYWKSFIAHDFVIVDDTAEEL